jgi:hypothetical protein
MASEKTLKGSCFCGEVQFEVSGEPAGMGYCHCESCRHWSAGPVNAFSLWNPQLVHEMRWPFVYRPPDHGTRRHLCSDVA